MIQMACYLLDQGCSNNQQQRRSMAKSVSAYLFSSPASSDSPTRPSSSSLSPACSSSGPSDETVQFMMVSSLLSECYEDWCQHRPAFLQRGIYHAYMQHKHGRSNLRLSPDSSSSPPTAIKPDEGSLTDPNDGSKLFAIIQPMLAYTGLVEQLQRFFKLSKGSNTGANNGGLERWEVVMKEKLLNVKEMVGFSKELLLWLEDMASAADLQEAFAKTSNPRIIPPIMEAALQGIIAAGVSFICISSLFVFFLLLCRRPPKSHPEFQTLTLAARSRPLSLPITTKPPPADEFSSFDPSLNHISMSELAAATKNFSSDAIVGDGGFGFVYRAELSTGVAVAVKKLSADAFHGFREFRAEVETLGRIRHPNLAKMLGFCISGSDRILIYEFIERGCLDQWIHDPNPNPLPWQTRIRIMHGVAKGLAFLHDECKPCIIHRDIKASNVLLDADFGSRIADFGLARLVGSEMSHVSTQVAGTMGYLPPEYREGLTVATVKGDVYSFGVLMFEVASGRRPNWPVKGEDGKEVWMVRWARALTETGRVMEVVDPLVGTTKEEEVKGFLDVACKCTEESAKKRPSMREVVSMLEAQVMKLV